MGKPVASAGLTPAKFGMIVVLAVVLLVVIVVQFGGGSSKKRSSRPRRTARAQATSDETSAAEPAAKAALPATPWPAYQLTDVVAHNPFAMPTDLQEAEETDDDPGDGETGEDVTVEPPDARDLRRRQSEFMNSLREQGVDMVLMTPNGSVARVGSTSFRVGDVVEGLVVKEITRQGITFEPADEEKDIETE